MMTLSTLCHEPERISKRYFTREITIQITLYNQLPNVGETGKKQGVTLLVLVQRVSKRKYIIPARSVCQCLRVYEHLVYDLSF